jgi:hypothetical protein
MGRSEEFAPSRGIESDLGPHFTAQYLVAGEQRAVFVATGLA